MSRGFSDSEGRVGRLRGGGGASQLMVRTRLLAERHVAPTQTRGQMRTWHGVADLDLTDFTARSDTVGPDYLYDRRGRSGRLLRALVQTGGCP